MIIHTDAMEIDVSGIYEEHDYTGSVSGRPVLRIRTDTALTDKQVKALLGGSITCEDGEGREAQYDGYNVIHGCTLTLAKEGDAEKEMAALREQAEAATTKHAAMARLTARLIVDDEAMEYADLWPMWQAGKACAKGEIVRHGDGLYRVEQAHTAQAHQPPDSAGMLAVYRPIREAAQDGEVLPWVHGEAVEIGDRRAHGGVVYECYAAAGANVHRPGLVAAVWKVVE